MYRIMDSKHLLEKILLGLELVTFLEEDTQVETLFRPSGKLWPYGNCFSRDIQLRRKLLLKGGVDKIDSNMQKIYLKKNSNH